MLVLTETVVQGRKKIAVCQCSCGVKVRLPYWEYRTGHKKTCGSKSCTSRALTESHKGKPRPDLVGKTPHNKIDRSGLRYGRLVATREDGGKWVCVCDCGNEVLVLSTNLAGYAKGNRGCRHCGGRKDITGETSGYLTAESVERGPVKGRPPLWTFRCRCGNSIQGTVREFHANWLRSCGCLDNAYTSWSAMISRCSDQSNNRYSSYGGRGIRVCSRWLDFSNFIQDMGERPKRHNLGRLNAEGDYEPGNCRWEHVSLNCRDTRNDGQPTVPGAAKGARPRKKGQKK